MTIIAKDWRKKKKKNHKQCGFCFPKHEMYHIHLHHKGRLCPSGKIHLYFPQRRSSRNVAAPNLGVASVAQTSSTSDMWQINGLPEETSAGLPPLSEDVFCLISTTGSPGLPLWTSTYPCFITRYFGKVENNHRAGRTNPKFKKKCSADCHSN